MKNQKSTRKQKTFFSQTLPIASGPSSHRNQWRGHISSPSRASAPCRIMRGAQSRLAGALSTAAAASRSSRSFFGSAGRGGPGDASSSTSSSAASSSVTASSSLASALRPIYALIHPDAVHGHAEAERVNSVAFHELREWSKDVERGGGVGGSARRLRFFVRRSGEEGAVSAVSAALPSPAAARRSRDPLVLLRPLLVAAGLA